MAMFWGSGRAFLWGVRGEEQGTQTYTVEAVSLNKFRDVTETVHR